MTGIDPAVMLPEEVEDCLTYLDELRESGKVNMFGAYPYLMRKFGLNKATAKAVWKHWAETFSERRKQ